MDPFRFYFRRLPSGDKTIVGIIDIIDIICLCATEPHIVSCCLTGHEPAVKERRRLKPQNCPKNGVNSKQNVEVSEEPLTHYPNP